MSERSVKLVLVAKLSVPSTLNILYFDDFTMRQRKTLMLSVNSLQQINLIKFSLVMLKMYWCLKASLKMNNLFLSIIPIKLFYA